MNTKKNITRLTKKNQNSGLSDVKQINERFIDNRILCTKKKHGTL